MWKIARESKVSDIGDRGALLIRPDQYIAWRSRDHFEAPERALLDAVRGILALPA